MPTGTTWSPSEGLFVAVSRVCLVLQSVQFEYGLASIFAGLCLYWNIALAQALSFYQTRSRHPTTQMIMIFGAFEKV